MTPDSARHNEIVLRRRRLTLEKDKLSLFRTFLFVKDVLRRWSACSSGNCALACRGSSRGRDAPGPHSTQHEGRQCCTFPVATTRRIGRGVHCGECLGGLLRYQSFATLFSSIWAHSCSKCVRRIRREKSVEVNPLYVAYDNPCDAKLWPQRHVQLGASDCCCALRTGVPDVVLAVDATDSFNQVINSAAFAGESASTTSRKTGSVPENRNKSQLSFSR